ncbi:MAG: OadG family protein [Roseburia sp.]|nr:OadG family protein [Roseburia sp.]
MKKFLSLICMLTCVLGLTACGAKEQQYSEFQQQKLEEAEHRTLQGYIPILTLFMDDDMLDVYSEYTLEEVESIFQESGISVDGYGFMSAAKSFNLNGETTGALTIKADAEPELIVDDDQIIVRVQMAGEKKDAEVELILSNDSFWKLEGGALNPISSFGELMGKAALNTLLGMGTVFSVLILICFIIAGFGLIPKIQKSLTGKKKEEENVTGIHNAVTQISRQEESLEESDDTELAAVIAAAIAAYEGSGNTDGYVVRSIRKINR